MSELTLTRDERLALRALAHHLDPVVLLGAAGLTEAVLKETDRALTAHELIKVRIPGDDREEREAIGTRIAERLGAAVVQVIGKLLVLYRPRPEQEAPQLPARSSSRPPKPEGSSRTAAGSTRSFRAKSRAKPRAPTAIPRRGGGRGR